MENYLKFIEMRLEQKLNFEKIEIIDNSYKHQKHKYFSKDKFHLKIKIKSLYLATLSRLSAQKLIMNILKEELKTKIHALEISIE